MASVSSNTSDYECDICGVGCRSELDLYDHDKLVHERKENEYTCNICAYANRDRSKVASHIKDIHSSKKYDCIICACTSLSNYGYINHQDSLHRFRDKYKCWTCLQEFDNFSLLIVHFKKGHSSSIVYIQKSLKCDECEYIARETSRLRNHILLMHSAVTYTCEICDIVLVSNHNYREHQRCEHINKYSDHPDRFICDACKQHYDRFGQLKQHYTRKGKFGVRDAPNTCNVCLDVFDTRISLGEHMTVHREEHPFQCIHCKYRYRAWSTLDIHTRQKHQE